MRIRNILFAAFAMAVIACDPTIPVSNVVVVPSEVTIKVGEERTLTAIVSPDNATEKTLIWSSSNMSVVAVQEGTIKGIGKGSASVSATSVDGGKTASCNVTVEDDEGPVGPVNPDVKVTSIEITPSALNLVVGKTGSLSATVLPDNASDKSVTWNSQDTNVATVSSSGLVTAVAPGSTTVRATASNGVYASCTVEVYTDYVAVTSVALDMHDVALQKGETYSLHATVMPDNATNPVLSWSSSSSCVTVSDNGMLTAVSGGEANITVSAEGGTVSDVCHVTVRVPVKSISLNMPYNVIYQHETCSLVATIDPEDATDKTVSWSANPAIVTLEANGLNCKVIPSASGTTIITVKTQDGGKTATCELEIEPTYVTGTSVEVTPSSLNLKVGQTATLTGKVLPENATAKAIQWSSLDDKIATVTSEGVVTAVAPGSTSIQALSPDGAEGYCSVTVTANTVAVTSVTLSQHTMTLKTGQSASLTASVGPSNATDKSLKWTSGSSAATVDENGKVTAVSVGTAVIKAESVSNPGVFDSCTVTVEASTVAVTSVSVSPTTLDLTVGDAYTLSATVNPSNATNKNVTWSSSNESVASVSSYGTVTAKAAGTAVIKAASPDGPYGTCTVTVKAKSITVTLSPASLTVIGGTSEILTATISPSNAENTTLIWKTTNSGIIKLNTVETSVTTYGSTASITVFGSRVGEADVTVASADNPSKILATCHVTVPSTYIQHLYFKDVQGKTINLKVGNTYRLKVIYEPKEADPVHLKWGYTSSHLSIIDFNNLDEVTVQAKKSNASDGSTVKVYVKDEDGHCSEEAICYFKITE